MDYVVGYRHVETYYADTNNCRFFICVDCAGETEIDEWEAVNYSDYEDYSTLKCFVCSALIFQDVE